MTEMYTVKSGEAVNVSEKVPGQKWVDENGYIIVVQDSYDTYYDREDGAAKGLWTGHAWKFYPFYFLNGEFTEVEARETNLETMDKMAPVPEDVRTRLTDMPDKHVAATQFIYREMTREMILNIAYDCSKDDMLSYRFENVKYRLSEDSDQAWEFVEENSGIYGLQYTKESFWEAVDGLE